MKPRGLVAEERKAHKVQGRPPRARDKRAVRRDRRHETKSLLEHLIELIQERKSAAEGQAAEKKEHG